jgi:hypothetical protein
MATTESGRIRVRSTAGGAEETKHALKTTEFLAFVATTLAILVAAAVSDSLNDVRAWTLIAGLGCAYMLSRGISKAGSRHHEDGNR